jgi:putative transposase
MGVLLGLTLTRARSKCGSRVEDLKPFYRGTKVTLFGAISLKQVVGLMTLSESMGGQAFEVFIQHFLVPNLWDGAVVVMDNLPAHKLAVIEPLM